MKQKNWWEWLADYFHFSARERWAVLVLVALVLLVWWLPSWLPRSLPSLITGEPAADSAVLRQLLATLPAVEYSPGRIDSARADDLSTPVKAHRPFPFDPNTAPVTTWMALGVNQQVAERIDRYRARGGRFRQAADIRKIYGLPETTADRLVPYVRLPVSSSRAFSGPAGQGANGKNGWRVAGNDSNPWQKGGATRFVNRPLPKLHLNQADSSDWEALPAIGPVLAGRIVRFREKLGGFRAASQLLEVFGLTDSAYQRIMPFLYTENLRWRRIPLNQASEAELAAHPYCRWKLARAIVAYREAHGPFLSVDELMDIHLVSPETYQKLAPYCQLEEQPP